MQRILNAIPMLATCESTIIANTAHAKMRVPVTRVEMIVKEMHAGIEDCLKTHKLSVRVDLKPVFYRMNWRPRSACHELEDMQALDTAFPAEFDARTSKSVARLGAPSSESPVKHVNLYIYFILYTVPDRQPVLSVTVKCTE